LRLGPLDASKDQERPHRSPSFPHAEEHGVQATQREVEDMKADRRTFLRLIGAAPVAVQEVASKMGLSSATDALQASGWVGGNNVGVPAHIGHSDWASEALRSFSTPFKQREFKERAAQSARILDPDLASLRSVSPSAAYSLQRDRCLDRVIDSERTWLEHQIEQRTKGLFG
jgi:hypothetical protein